MNSFRDMGLQAVKDTLEKIRSVMIDEVGDNLKCLVLCGSWAKGTAREDSDIGEPPLDDSGVNRSSGFGYYETKREEFSLR